MRLTGAQLMMKIALQGRFDAPSKRVDTSVDAADTSVRATGLSPAESGSYAKLPESAERDGLAMERHTASPRTRGSLEFVVCVAFDLLFLLGAPCTAFN